MLTKEVWDEIVPNFTLVELEEIFKVCITKVSGYQLNIKMVDDNTMLLCFECTERIKHYKWNISLTEKTSQDLSRISAHFGEVKKHLDTELTKHPEYSAETIGALQSFYSLFDISLSQLETDVRDTFCDLKKEMTILPYIAPAPTTQPLAKTQPTPNTDVHANTNKKAPPRNKIQWQHSQPRSDQTESFTESTESSEILSDSAERAVSKLRSRLAVKKQITNDDLLEEKFEQGTQSKTKTASGGHTIPATKRLSASETSDDSDNMAKCTSDEYSDELDPPKTIAEQTASAKPKKENSEKEIVITSEDEAENIIQQMDRIPKRKRGNKANNKHDKGTSHLSYHQFVAKRLKEQRKKNPGMSELYYSNAVRAAWKKYQKNLED